MSSNLKPLCSASSEAVRGGVSGGSCRTIEPERAHTLLLSLAPGGGGNLTSRPGPPPLTWNKASSCTPRPQQQPPSFPLLFIMQELARHNSHCPKCWSFRAASCCSLKRSTLVLRAETPHRLTELQRPFQGIQDCLTHIISNTFFSVIYNNTAFIFQ